MMKTAVSQFQCHCSKIEEYVMNHHRLSLQVGRSVVGLAFTVLSVAFAADWLTHHNKILGLSIAHPQDWSARVSKNTVRFASKDASGAFIVRIDPSMKLEAWAQLRRKAEVLPDGSSRVEKTSDSRLAGRPAKRIVLFGFDRSIVEEAVNANGKLYVIQYDSENPNDAAFAQHKSIYAKMRDSLKF
jgi:hypothetical protein